MEITAQTPTTAAPDASTTTAQSSSALTSDFDTFLKMLTVQMQNQDPLNPIDSADYAVQLATFSGVEQQVQTNDLLRSLGAGGSLGGLAQHADWVGMQARTEGPVTFAGQPVQVDYELPVDAVSAELVVSDTGGQELYRQPVTGPGPLAWDGISPTGGQLLAGPYTLAVETRNASGRTETGPVSTYARVTEVQSGSEGPMIVLDNGTTVSADSITALRDG
jgi:flagellar basal-body rod modification protein FlgD